MLAVALATVGALLVTAPAASAHATVVASDPGPGAVVATAPSTVTVSFDEQVAVADDSLRILDPAGARVDVGGAVRGARAGSVTVRLRPGLLDGTYVVAWHVVSADSHPVQGAFTFSIGAPSATAVDLSSVNPPGDRTVGLLYGVARFLAFAGYALLVGAVAFLAVCWPAGAGRGDVFALVQRGWALLMLGSLGSLLLQGVYGTGGGLTHATHPQVLQATFHTPLGVALGVRLGALALLVPCRNLLSRLTTAADRGRTVFAAVWALFGAGLAATWAAAGHASVGIQTPLAVLADSAHLLAMAVWIGGLVTLAWIVLRRADTAQARTAAPRFSTVALGAVAVVITTGAYQAWRGVGSLDALITTSYGRLVLIKMIAMAGLVALGYLARSGIPVLVGPGAAAADDRTDVRELRRTVTTEVVITTLVLAVSALLVTTHTGRESTPVRPPATSTAVFDTGGPGGRGSLEAELSPGRPGPNQLRLTLTGTGGAAFRAAEVTASLSLADHGIAALAVPLSDTGTGTYTAAVSTLTLPGSWTLAVTIRSDDVDETTVRVPVQVR